MQTINSDYAIFSFDAHCIDGYNQWLDDHIRDVLKVLVPASRPTKLASAS